MKLSTAEEAKRALELAERMLCRSERLIDLAKNSGGTFREDAVSRWIMSGCRTCGQCPEMAIS